MFEYNAQKASNQSDKRQIDKEIRFPAQQTVEFQRGRFTANIICRSCRLHLEISLPVSCLSRNCLNAQFVCIRRARSPFSYQYSQQPFPLDQKVKSQSLKICLIRDSSLTHILTNNQHLSALCLHFLTAFAYCYPLIVAPAFLPSHTHTLHHNSFKQISQPPNFGEGNESSEQKQRGPSCLSSPDHNRVRLRCCTAIPLPPMTDPANSMVLNISLLGSQEAASEPIAQGCLRRFKVGGRRFLEEPMYLSLIHI
eukprot:TRINITY_DN23608_c0_g1_i1.p1 TRINITY_DN23608_c0_g1~~TRINITY_DN23608_c0_g1_i1.p1  ORF type:complete len:253 (+),score=-40.53 TRINITY_DN23608_c0_g1_i1:230-988(+)